MKTIIITILTLISLNTFANSKEPASILAAVPDYVIEKINIAGSEHKNATLMVGDCWRAHGSVICHPPCQNSSNINTGCQDSPAAAHVMAGYLVADLCGSCGATVSYEVGCSEC